MSDRAFVMLKAWAKELGWADLQKLQKHVTTSQHVNTVITWYQAGQPTGGRNHLALQINENPIGQARTYQAAVYAIRFRMCSGWHRLTLAATDDICSEARRLRRWLDRSWFETIKGRREYRRMHPECANFTWRRLRDEGPPYTARR